MTEPKLPPEPGIDATTGIEADVERVKNISTRLAERLTGSTSPPPATFTPTATAFTRAVSQATGNITRNAGQATTRARRQPRSTLRGVGAGIAVVTLGWLTWRAARSGPPTHQVSSPSD